MDRLKSSLKWKMKRKVLKKIGKKLRQERQAGESSTTVDCDFLNHFGVKPSERDAILKSVVTVTSLYYCKSGMGVSHSKENENSGNSSPFPEPVAGGLNHDFLIVQFDLKQATTEGMTRFFIKAEKTIEYHESKEKCVKFCGIRIALLPDRLDFQKNIWLRTPCKVQINFDDMMFPLGAPDPGYHLTDSNCWHYAFEAAKGLLRTLADCSTGDEKRKLAKVATHLREILDKRNKATPSEYVENAAKFAIALVREACS